MAFTEGFRVKRIMTDRCRKRQERIADRLDKSNFPEDLSRPMFRATNIQYEIAERAVGTPYGGIGLIHQLAKMIGLPAPLDTIDIHVDPLRYRIIPSSDSFC